MGVLCGVSNWMYLEKEHSTSALVVNDYDLWPCTATLRLRKRGIMCKLLDCVHFIKLYGRSPIMCAYNCLIPLTLLDIVRKKYILPKLLIWNWECTHPFQSATASQAQWLIRFINFKFLVSCDRLSLLPVSYWVHVKYLHIMSDCIEENSVHWQRTSSEFPLALPLIHSEASGMISHWMPLSQHEPSYHWYTQKPVVWFHTECHCHSMSQATSCQRLSSCSLQTCQMPPARHTCS